MFPDIPLIDYQCFTVGNVGKCGETLNPFPTFGTFPDIIPTLILLYFNKLYMLGKLGGKKWLIII